MSAIINGDSPSVTFSDGTTQATSAIVSGKVPYTNLPAGSVLQVVTNTYSTQVTTSSNSFVSAGLTATITPKYSTSKILIIVSTAGRNDSTVYTAYYTIFRGAVAGGTNLGATNGMLQMYTAANALRTQVSLNYLDSPATTSATTYTLAMQGENAANTVYAQNNNLLGSMTLMEIAG